MNLKRKSWGLLAVVVVALLSASCDRGPLEKAGRAVDRAGEKAGDKIRDLTK